MKAPVSALAMTLLGLVAACSASYDEGIEEFHAVDKNDAKPATSESGQNGPIRSVSADGFKMGLVTGRIYDDMAKNLGRTLGDMHALGVDLYRVEIEGKDDSKYAAIANAASSKYGMEMLALVSQAATSDPLDGDIDWFNGTFCDSVIARIDSLMNAIPSLKYVEVWNEPDVYGFFLGYPDQPNGQGAIKPGTENTTRVVMPTQQERGRRYALLLKRVYEHTITVRKTGARTPTIVGGDFSRHDEAGLRKLVWNQQEITDHRNGFRPGASLPDGPPVDILSIHGYGNRDAQQRDYLPDEQGYSYQGTLDDGVNDLLAWNFADGRSLTANVPIWYTEIGISRKTRGDDGQQRAVRTSFDVLRRHMPKIQAAFWYDYRDDDGGAEHNTNGLRGNKSETFRRCPNVADPSPKWSNWPFAKHPAWDTYADVSGARGQTSFSDVDECHWAHDAIESMYARGITRGCESGKYCPDAQLTQSELDTFARRCAGNLGAEPVANSPLARRVDVATYFGKTGQKGYQGHFVDVPYTSDNSNHWQEIENLKDRGITVGTDAGNGKRAYNPDSNLTRAELATFLTRAYDMESDLADYP